MKLRDRVRQHLLADRPPPPSAPPRDAPASRQARIAALRREIARIEEHWSRPSAPRAPVPAPAAAAERCDAVPRLHHQRWAPGERWGREAMPGGGALQRLAELVRQVLALEQGLALDPGRPRPGELLFIDTETTGLSRAAGTLVFLVGVGTFDAAGGFVVEQLFLRDPDEEPEMLARLAEHLARARVIVSFNGRAFDLPLLRNRAVLARTPLPLELPHVDLLPLCRRVFRGRTTNCRLTTLEREVLGVEREDDVDGSEVPEIYLEYLRTGRPGRIDRVIAHNRADIASLAPLLGLTCEHLLDPLHWAEDGEELLAVGLFRLQHGDAAVAERCFTRGLDLARSRHARARLFCELARLCRRRGDTAAARALWERYVEEFPRENLGFVELAKHCEHVARDLPRALAYAERAPHGDDELAHRLARLRRRIGD